jgi:hypothetical protein
LRTANAALELFREAAAAGWQGRDLSAVVETLRAGKS